MARVGGLKAAKPQAKFPKGGVMKTERLLATLAEASEELGVPVGSLRNAAAEHGFLKRFGRSLRIARADYQGLIEACHNGPRERESTSARTTGGGSSAKADASMYQQALATAAKLKSLSPTTSPQGTGQVARLPPRG